MDIPTHMEAHLISIGVLPKSYFQELEDQVSPPSREYETFRDPRDGNGEVPF